MELQPWLTVWCLIYKSIHWSVGWLMAIRAFGFLFWVLWKPHNAHSCSAHLSLFLSFSLSFSHSCFIPRCLKLWCQAFSSSFFSLKGIKQPISFYPWNNKILRYRDRMLLLPQAPTRKSLCITASSCRNIHGHCSVCKIPKLFFFFSRWMYS